MPAAVIELERLTRTYWLGDTEVRALDEVTLRIERGEFVAIMGASGSGKSTLMNICGCLDRPSDGRYLFEGIDVAGLREPALARLRSERIGFVFQSFNLLSRTSAVENVALPLYYAVTGPASRSERLQRARTALAALGLGSRERSSPAQLSGGQQQRVAIARAMAGEPRVILADEPTGNLDTEMSGQIMDLLEEVNAAGTLIVMVTHNPDLAKRARRHIEITDGEISQHRRSGPQEPLGAAAPVAL